VQKEFKVTIKDPQISSVERFFGMALSGWKGDVFQAMNYDVT